MFAKLKYDGSNMLLDPTKLGLVMITRPKHLRSSMVVVVVLIFSIIIIIIVVVVVVVVVVVLIISWIRCVYLTPSKPWSCIFTRSK